MHSMKIPVVLLSALALAAPGATSFAKDKGKNKDKAKDKSAQTDDRGGRNGNGNGNGDDRDGGGDQGDKVTICHVPGGNPGNRHTITVGASAWEAHRSHGDYRGACRENDPGPGNGDRFDTLDRNDDGVISRREWNGDAATFDRLDRNDDGVISRREFSR